jgi:wyosine [tRNA(Phe)-imidazoG37] synthetase (radical SAM superfamily)
MAGILFDEIVFGPVKSRRFGISLGINLLPLHRKLCSFNCIYCECGLTDLVDADASALYSAAQIAASLEERFKALTENHLKPDNITFAGNGEPTLHPEFETIVGEVIRLRDRYFPAAKTTVLSNASQLGREDVKLALLRVDNNVLKLDAGTEATFKAMNRPHTEVTLGDIVKNLKIFNGNLIIQTILVRGEVDGSWVDNTREEEISEYLRLLESIIPKFVMLYPIDRRTPYSRLEKVPYVEFEILHRKIEALGIKAEIYY